MIERCRCRFVLDASITWSRTDALAPSGPDLAERNRPVRSQIEWRSIIPIATSILQPCHESRLLQLSRKKEKKTNGLFYPLRYELHTRYTLLGPRTPLEKYVDTFSMLTQTVPTYFQFPISPLYCGRS